MRRNTLNLWLNFSSLVATGMLALSGLIMYFVLPPGTGGRGRGAAVTLFGWDRHSWGEVHLYIAFTFLGLIAVHVWLHWSWVSCMVMRLLGRARPRNRNSLWVRVALSTGMVAVVAGSLVWATTVVRRDGDGLRNGWRRQMALPGAEEVPGQTSESHVAAAARHSSACPMEARGKDRHMRTRMRSDEVHGPMHDHLGLNGRTSLEQLARASDMTVSELREEIGVPSGVDPRERLGRLKRRYGLDMHKVRAFVLRRQQSL